MVKWFDFRLEPIFANDPVRPKRGKKEPKMNNLTTFFPRLRSAIELGLKMQL